MKSETVALSINKKKCLSIQTVERNCKVMLDTFGLGRRDTEACLRSFPAGMLLMLKFLFFATEFLAKNEVVNLLTRILTLGHFLTL